MEPSEEPTRRRFGALVGSTATLGFLAGCGGPGTEDEGEPEFEEGTGNGQDIDSDNESGGQADNESENESGGESGNESGNNSGS